MLGHLEPINKVLGHPKMWMVRTFFYFKTFESHVGQIIKTAVKTNDVTH